MAGMRAAKLGKATAWFLQNPNASITDAAMALPAISERTCAQARSNLAAKGLLIPGRNRFEASGRERKAPDEQRTVPTADPPIPVPLGPDRALALPDGTLLDDANMRALADPNSGFLADLDLDDEETRKKLLREVKRIAFDVEAHPDTRLSATQVWLKLKDMAKTRELGPGVPLTREAAVTRLKDLISAVGLELAVEALLLAFGIARLVTALYKLTQLETPPDERQVPADEVSAPLGPAGTGSAPGGEDHDESPA
jgi:hypothetical protein